MLNKFICLFLLLVITGTSLKAQEEYGTCATAIMDSLIETAPPTGLTSSLTTDRFFIHYSTSGPDATTPAYAESVGVFAEESWDKLCNDLGWLEPASDGTDGGDSRYDIYIVAINEQVDGYTTARAGSTDIYIKKGLTVFPRLKLAVAHEFHHASQYSYFNNFTNKAYWYREGIAVYMSHIVYPNSMTNYLNFTNVDGLLPKCYLRINDSLAAYSNAIWWDFLTEWLNDPSVVKKMWEEFDNANGNAPLAQIQKVLSQQYSTSLTIALKQFAVWRYFTDVRGDAWHYTLGSYYSSVSVTVPPLTVPFNVDNSSSNSKPSGPGGVRYWKLAGGYGTITAKFDGQNDKKWAAFVIGSKNPSPSDIYEIPLTGDTGRISFEWASADSFVLLAIALDTSNANNLTFSYDVSVDPRVSVTFTNKIHNTNAG